MPRADWLQRLQVEDVPCSPVYRFEDVFEDPQVVHNGTVIELEHPEVGKYKTIRNPIGMSFTPVRPWGYAPQLGEDTTTILEEIGYSAEQIADLLRAGVVTGG